MALQMAAAQMAPPMAAQMPPARGRRGSRKKEDPTELLRLEFWRRLAARLGEAELPTHPPFSSRTHGIYLRKREDPYWDRFPVRRGLFFAVLEDRRAGHLRVSFIVDHPEYSGRVLQMLAEHQPEIERCLRRPTGLDVGDGDSLRRELFVRRPAEITDSMFWPHYHAWSVEQLLRLRRALRTHLNRALSQL